MVFCFSVSPSRLNMKATRPIGFFLFCTLLPGVIAHAQLSPRLQQLRNITFDHISSEQGLPSDGVHAIIEDSRGFMWFGTEGGLCRYDGYSVVVYRPSEADSTSVSGSIVGSLLLDSKGETIWVGSEGGLDAYNISTSKFTRFASVQSDSSTLSGLPINSIFQNRRGTLWVGSGNGLNQLVVDSSGRRKFIRYVNNPNDSTSLSWNWVAAVSGEDDGTIWVGTSRTAVSRLDPTTKKFTRILFVPRDAPDQEKNKIFPPMVRDHDGIFWVPTVRDVIRFDPRTGLAAPVKHSPSDLHSLSGSGFLGMCMDNAGILWLGTPDNGLHALDTETGQCVRFAHDPTDPRSLCSNNVVCLYMDQRGSLWIGTKDGGVSRIERARHQSTRLRKEPGNPNSLSDNCVWEMVEDDQGTVWIGTSSGLNRYNRAKGMFTHYDPNNPRSLSHQVVSRVHKDRDGAIWAGTKEGLNRIDPVTGYLTRYYNETAPPRSYTKNIIMDVYQDNEGTLWVGTWDGLKIVNIKKKRFEDFAYTDFPHQILRDRNGQYFWVATGEMDC